MKTTRCKFKCMSKTQTTEGFNVRFAPVTGGSDENKAFFKWTPTGQLEFGTINEEAAADFIPGEEYYIDITAVK